MKLNWKVTTFSVFFFVVFCRLGLWQLDRAEEKIELLDTQAEIANRAPATLSDIVHSGFQTAALSGRRVRLNGQYQESLYLLDNRVVEGIVGYEVLVPFFDQDSELAVLVNRGFVPMGRTREEVPSIPNIIETRTALGSIYVQERLNGSVDEVTKREDGAFVLLQRPDPTLVAGQFNGKLFGHVLRLDKADPNALPRHWPVSVMMPETHRGYAVQWFLMAIAVVIAFVAFTIKNVARESHDHDAV